MVSLRLLPALILVAVFIGCGGDAPPKTTPKTQTASAPGAQGKPARSTDRGARRCTRAAFLAALLADVDPQPFKVDEVRCKGDFARSRFVNVGCASQQATGVACDGAKVAAWRLGAKRWRLIAYYGDGLRCDDVRRQAKDFPSSLCD